MSPIDEGEGAREARVQTERPGSIVNVPSWNAAFPKYPVTVEDKGWVYGVWYCGTAWSRVSLHGQYPPGFLKRALALFPDVAHSRILHAPSGTILGPGVTLDLISDEVRKPQFIGDCGSMPFEDGSFDLILSDPPYTPKDSEIYGCPRFPMGKFMKEAHRVLAPGGHVGVLHTYYPSYRRKQFALVGLIAVVTGFMRATRIFSIFKRLPMIPTGRPESESVA